MPEPIDLRGLDPPEPLTRILASLESGDGPHAFLLSREPFPLYALLAPQWRHSVRKDAGSVLLTITRRL